jgi:hypothetical protein
MATIPNVRPRLSPRQMLESYRRANPALLVLILVFCFCLLTSFRGHARTNATPSQEKPYALIFGTVWGPDDRPLYGVTVKIRRETDKKARWELLSDRRGEFAQRVPAGKQDYVIWADLKNYPSPEVRQLHADDVKVHVEYDERVDTGLHLKQ